MEADGKKKAGRPRGLPIKIVGVRLPVEVAEWAQKKGLRKMIQTLYDVDQRLQSFTNKYLSDGPRCGVCGELARFDEETYPDPQCACTQKT